MVANPTVHGIRDNIKDEIDKFLKVIVTEQLPTVQPGRRPQVQDTRNFLPFVMSKYLSGRIQCGPSSRCKPMKVWGIIFILTAIPGWIYVVWWLHRLTRRNRFDAYDLGTPAMHYPHLMRTAGRFAVLATVIGFAFLLFDFVQWMRRKSRSRSSILIKYNGKTVKVAAKSASLEAAIFLDYAGGNARISRSRGKSLRSRKSEDAVKWKA